MERHAFARFGVRLDESRARFDEGMEQVRLLLEHENVTCEGRFHSFRDVTSLPRPTQHPAANGAAKKNNHTDTTPTT